MRDSSRRHLNHWDILIDVGEGGAEEVIDALRETLVIEEVGEVSDTAEATGFLGLGRSGRVLRVKRRDVEIDIGVKLTGHELYVSWDAYYRATFADRHLPNVGREILTGDERRDFQAFASVTLDIVRDVASRLALSRHAKPIRSEAPPDEGLSGDDGLSGVLGPLD